MNVFCERLKSLRNAAKLNQTELGEKLNCQRTRIADLERGKSTPTIEDITILCKTFNVSSDYLLGISDIATTDTELKEVCEYTGLSEDAIEQLHELEPQNSDIINYLLGDDVLVSAIDLLQKSKLCSQSSEWLLSELYSILTTIPNFKEQYKVFSGYCDKNGFENFKKLIGDELHEKIKNIIKQAIEKSTIEKRQFPNIFFTCQTIIDIAILIALDLNEMAEYYFYSAMKQIEDIMSDYCIDSTNTEDITGKITQMIWQSESKKKRTKIIHTEPVYEDKFTTEW